MIIFSLIGAFLNDGNTAAAKKGQEPMSSQNLLSSGKGEMTLLISKDEVLIKHKTEKEGKEYFLYVK